MTARTLARAGLIVTAAFFLSRVLGWLRLIVISNLYGAQADLDAYFAAFRIPDAIYQLVAAGALSSAMIPVLSGLIANDEDARAWRVVSTVINLMMLALLVLAVAVAIFAPLIIPPVTPGFDAVGTELTVKLSRIMLLSPVLLALGAVATSVLNTQGRFAASAIAPILYNVSIIGAAVVLAPFMGVEALAIGVVLGSLFHLAIQLPPLLRGRFNYDFGIDLRDPAARQTLLLMAPRAIGLGASQITFLVNTTLASTVQVGAIVAYNIAFTIVQIPIGVIGMPLGVVLLPAMSRAIARGSVREFGHILVQTLRLLLFAILFITVVAMVLRRQIVTLLFDYGRFDAAALDLTANTLLFFLVGLAGHSMIAILARAFYSGQDTRTPVVAAILSVAVNVVISFATVGSLGLSGLALGIAVGAWVEAAFLGILLWQRTPGSGLETVLQALVVFGVGALLAGIAAVAAVRASEPFMGLDPGKLAIILQSGIATLAAGLVYGLYAWLVRAPELSRSLSLLRSALRRGHG